ncbi:SHOCT domain-containing protein [Timonella senegalensis]|uniref:SHOCT domain-containing protein n=1 Tax=Timonella senegalensis TaxID=1465825 RepID=UPI00031D9785|nr:SHOCT domain-containing protein [Timonella senegalensis]
MSFLNSLWDVVLMFFWASIFIAALVVMFMVVTDLIRDKNLSGWWKALWILALIFVPVLTSLVYLIARGDGMAERSVKEANEMRDKSEEYIRSVAGKSPAEEIASAKALLDSGAITPEEFGSLKARALAG